MERFNELMCDKIQYLRKTTRHYKSKDALDLSVHMFFLKDLQEESVRPIKHILNRTPECKYTQKIFSYLKEFNL